MSSTEALVLLDECIDSVRAGGLAPVSPQPPAITTPVKKHTLQVTWHPQNHNAKAVFMGIELVHNVEVTPFVDPNFDRLLVGFSWDGAEPVSMKLIHCLSAISNATDTGTHLGLSLARSRLLQLALDFSVNVVKKGHTLSHEDLNDLLFADGGRIHKDLQQIDEALAIVMTLKAQIKSEEECSEQRRADHKDASSEEKEQAPASQPRQHSVAEYVLFNAMWGLLETLKKKHDKAVVQRIGKMFDNIMALVRSVLKNEGAKQFMQQLRTTHHWWTLPEATATGTVAVKDAVDPTAVSGAPKVAAKMLAIGEPKNQEQAKEAEEDEKHVEAEKHVVEAKKADGSCSDDSDSSSDSGDDSSAENKDENTEKKSRKFADASIEVVKVSEASPKEASHKPKTAATVASTEAVPPKVVDAMDLLLAPVSDSSDESVASLTTYMPPGRVPFRITDHIDTEPVAGGNTQDSESDDDSSSSSSSSSASSKRKLINPDSKPIPLSTKPMEAPKTATVVSKPGEAPRKQMSAKEAMGRAMANAVHRPGAGPRREPRRVGAPFESRPPMAHRRDDGGRPPFARPPFERRRDEDRGGGRSFGGGGFGGGDRFGGRVTRIGGDVRGLEAKGEKFRAPDYLGPMHERSRRDDFGRHGPGPMGPGPMGPMMAAPPPRGGDFGGRHEERRDDRANDRRGDGGKALAARGGATAGGRIGAVPMDNGYIPPKAVPFEAPGAKLGLRPSAAAFRPTPKGRMAAARHSGGVGTGVAVLPFGMQPPVAGEIVGAQTVPALLLQMQEMMAQMLDDRFGKETERDRGKEKRRKRKKQKRAAKKSKSSRKGKKKKHLSAAASSRRSTRYDEEEEDGDSGNSSDERDEDFFEERSRSERRRKRHSHHSRRRSPSNDEFSTSTDS